VVNLVISPTTAVFLSLPYRLHRTRHSFILILIIVITTTTTTFVAGNKAPTSLFLPNSFAPTLMC
jgi:hypothetical protein